MEFIASLVLQISAKFATLSFLVLEVQIFVWVESGC